MDPHAEQIALSSPSRVHIPPVMGAQWSTPGEGNVYLSSQRVRKSSLKGALDALQRRSTAGACPLLSATLDACKVSSLPTDTSALASMHRLRLRSGTLRLKAFPTSFWSSLLNLSHLDLRNNNAKKLPAELPPSLTRLNVSHNALSGAFPPPCVLRCPLLRRLDASHNRWTTLEPDWSPLSALQALDVSGNEALGLVSGWECLGTLPSLQRLLMASLALAVVPSSLCAALCACTRLQHLSLAHNRLTALPAALLTTLGPSLLSLRLNGNQFTALPSALSHATRLTSLYAHENALTSLPRSIRHCQALRRIHVEYNRLASLPHELQYARRLLVLVAHHNALTEVPAFLSAMPQLLRLSLAWNPFLDPKVGQAVQSHGALYLLAQSAASHDHDDSPSSSSSSSASEGPSARPRPVLKRSATVHIAAGHARPRRSRSRSALRCKSADRCVQERMSQLPLPSLPACVSPRAPVAPRVGFRERTLSMAALVSPRMMVPLAAVREQQEEEEEDEEEGNGYGMEVQQQEPMSVAPSIALRGAKLPSSDASKAVWVRHMYHLDLSRRQQEHYRKAGDRERWLLMAQSMDSVLDLLLLHEEDVAAREASAGRKSPRNRSPRSRAHTSPEEHETVRSAHEAAVHVREGSRSGRHVRLVHTRMHQSSLWLCIFVQYDGLHGLCAGLRGAVRYGVTTSAWANRPSFSLSTDGEQQLTEEWILMAIQCVQRAFDVLWRTVLLTDDVLNVCSCFIYCDSPDVRSIALQILSSAARILDVGHVVVLDALAWAHAQCRVEGGDSGTEDDEGVPVGERKAREEDRLQPLSYLLRSHRSTPEDRVQALHIVNTLLTVADADATRIALRNEFLALGPFYAGVCDCVRELRETDTATADALEEQLDAFVRDLRDDAMDGLVGAPQEGQGVEPAIGKLVRDTLVKLEEQQQETPPQQAPVLSTASGPPAQLLRAALQRLSTSPTSSTLNPMRVDGGSATPFSGSPVSRPSDGKREARAGKGDGAVTVRVVDDGTGDECTLEVRMDASVADFVLQLLATFESDMLEDYGVYYWEPVPEPGSPESANGTRVWLSEMRSMCHYWSLLGTRRLHFAIVPVPLKVLLASGQTQFVLLDLHRDVATAQQVVCRAADMDPSQVAHVYRWDSDDAEPTLLHRNGSSLASQGVQPYSMLVMQPASLGTGWASLLGSRRGSSNSRPNSRRGSPADPVAASALIGRAAGATATATATAESAPGNGKGSWKPVARSHVNVWEEAEGEAAYIAMDGYEEANGVPGSGLRADGPGYASPRSSGPVVLSATLNQLITRLTSIHTVDPDLTRIVLTTFGSIAPTSVLVDKLMERYNVPASAGLDANQVKQVRVRVCLLLKRFLQERYLRQQAEPDDMMRIVTFIERQLPADDLDTMKAALWKVFSKPTTAPATLATATPDTASPKPHIPKVRLMELMGAADIHSEELARQLLLNVWPVYDAMRPPEFLNVAWSKDQRKAPNVLAAIDCFNTLGVRVVQSILAETSVRRRAVIMAHWIDVASALRRLCDFHSLTAVISGLSHSAVARLKWTMLRLSDRQRLRLEQLQELVAPYQSYKAYRLAYHEATSFAVPYMGVYLTDLTSIGYGAPTFVGPDDTHVNVHKLRVIHGIITEVIRFQGKKPPFVRVDGIQNWLEKAFKMREDREMYEISLRLEPKGASSVQ